jgi:nucleoside-diphosphate-sugar epimerase
MSTRPVVITGVAGNLGRRLLLQLSDSDVIGIDVRPPEDTSLARFEQMDFGTEEACERLNVLLRESGAGSVVHLAYVLDPLQTGVLDEERMWQINVAGTARVMEAISVANRHGARVRKFIFPSSVSAYGPETPPLVDEDHPLGAHTLPYAIHKQASDEVVRYRQDWMEECRSYLLRPHIFTGATVRNYMVGALRGTPTGKGKRAEKMREQGKRLPLMLPWGSEYPEKQLQFVHVDDVARLIAYLLRRDGEGDPQLTILNVAGRGAPMTIRQCAQMANSKIHRVPNRRICSLVLRKFWDWGISGIPPEALPYMLGSYTMDTSRLQRFLGADYTEVIQHTVEEALQDSFKGSVGEAASS